MTARLRNHHVLLLGIGSAAFAMAACAAPDVAHSVADTKETTQASSVVVDMQSESGTSLGTCSGTLISSKTVLTAGHCIAGVKSWSVTSNGKTVKGSVGSTSWTTFGSDLSHPEHSDVGIIALDSEIKLSSYPSIATKVAADGTKGIQFHRASDTAKTFSSSTVTLQGGASKGFRLNYLISASGSFVDPGAAVLDSNNNIVGVVSGKGKTSGLLHVARVENFRTWAKSATTCAAALAVRDWGSGNSDTGGAGYGGTPTTSTSSSGGWNGGNGGSTWGSSSGGYGGGDGSGNGNTGSIDGSSTVPGYNPNGTASSTSSSSSSSSSSSGSSGTTPVNGGDGSNTCPGAPVCEGSDCGAGGSGLNGGTGSTTPSSSGGIDNGTTTGGSSTVQNPGGGTTTTTKNPDGSTTVTTVTPSTGGSGGSTTVTQTKYPNGTTTTTVTQPNGTTTSSTTDANGNPTTAPTTGTPGTGEGCSGSQDNSETCPTAADSATCASATCGACAAGTACADVNIEYGACGAGACGPASTATILK